MDTLGLVETKSIAAGVRVADLMMKRAEVRLVRAGTICSGRYMIQVSGQREAVKTSVTAAEESGGAIAGAFLLSNISPEVLAALKQQIPVETGCSLGVVECRTATAGIAAADTAVKSAQVVLAKLVTGRGINGKSYFVLAGDLADVAAGIAAVKEKFQKNLIHAVVIPSPDESVMNALIKVKR